MTLTPEQRKSFIESISSAAKSAYDKYGVPASVTLAQAILESGWGQSSLVKEANNYFGIKKHGNLDYMEFPTTEWVNGVQEHVKADFVKYPDATASFEDHASLLSSLPRYQPAMALNSDPVSFAKKLGPCGYSTNPNYGSVLVILMNEYNLTQYDTKTS